MLKIGKLTDYAIVVLEFMARRPGRVYAASELADVVKLAAPTVSKVLKQLAKSGVIRSTRGARGGYSLNGAPATISVASVIQVMEGPIALTDCGAAQQSCEQSGSCQTKASWELINRAVHNALESVTIADMVAATQQPRGEILVQIDRLQRSAVTARVIL